MFKRKLLNLLFKVVNLLTPKIKKSIYVNLGISSKNNYEDLINNSGNNVLKFIDVFMKNRFKDKVYIFVEYFDEKRFLLYDTIMENAIQNNIHLKFIRCYADQKGIKKFIFLLKKYHYLFKTKYWIVGTGDTYLFGKLKGQFLLNLNYFISCKSDLVVGNNDRWKHLDGMLTTSLLASTVVSSQTGVKLDHCWELGFPRNDTLFKTDKKDVILIRVGFFAKRADNNLLFMLLYS